MKPFRNRKIGIRVSTGFPLITDKGLIEFAGRFRESAVGNYMSLPKLILLFSGLKDTTKVPSLRSIKRAIRLLEKAIENARQSEQHEKQRGEFKFPVLIKIQTKTRFNHFLTKINFMEKRRGEGPLNEKKLRRTPHHASGRREFFNALKNKQYE